MPTRMVCRDRMERRPSRPWVAGAAICAAILLLCVFAFAGDAKKVLNVFTWENYFDPEVIRLFEQEQDCHVEFTYYDSNETMYETLTTGGGYDIMTPPTNESAALAKAGLLLELDYKRIPNLTYVDPNTPSLAEDPKMRFAVPYTATVTGIGYNKDVVPLEALANWNIFADMRFHKRMTMLNDSREVLGVALKHLGYSLNSTDRDEIASAGRLVQEWKNNLALFGVDDAKEGLLSGRFVAIQAYNGDIAPYLESHPEIGFHVPGEGSALNADMFVIGHDADDLDLSHAFINYMLTPRVATANMVGVGYYMPIPEAVAALPETLRNNPAFSLPPETMRGCEFVRNLAPDIYAIYDEVWAMVLLGGD